MSRQYTVGRSVGCSKCKLNEAIPGQRYCQPCKTEWTRNRRRQMGGNIALTPEERKKMNARAYLHVYIKRGKVEVGPCATCGSMKELEAHHHDYDKPLEVTWHCRKHHVREENRLRGHANHVYGEVDNHDEGCITSSMKTFIGAALIVGVFTLFCPLPSARAGVPCPGSTDPRDIALANQNMQKARDRVANICVAPAPVIVVDPQTAELRAIRDELRRIRMQQADFSTP